MSCFHKYLPLLMLNMINPSGRGVLFQLKLFIAAHTSCSVNSSTKLLLTLSKHIPKPPSNISLFTRSSEVGLIEDEHFLLDILRTLNHMPVKGNRIKGIRLSVRDDEMKTRTILVPLSTNFASISGSITRDGNGAGRCGIYPPRTAWFL